MHAMHLNVMTWAVIYGVRWGYNMCILLPVSNNLNCTYHIANLRLRNCGFFFYPFFPQLVLLFM